MEDKMLNHQNEVSNLSKEQYHFVTKEKFRMQVDEFSNNIEAYKEETLPELVKLMDSV